MSGLHDRCFDLIRGEPVCFAFEFKKSTVGIDLQLIRNVFREQRQNVLT